MMCYRDTTFCIAECANTTCPRKYTDKVQRFAEIWWEAIQALEAYIVKRAGLIVKEKE